MNIVLVTHDSVFGRYFARTLAESCRIDRVLVETAKAPLRYYGRKLRRVGPLNFGFQYLLNQWFERQGTRHLPSVAFPEHERIASINDITFDDDDCVIAFGSSYVTARTLSSVGLGVLNLHTGILPHYRGVKSEFWALRNRDFTNIGWTLHYMTSRLDEGDIVLRESVPWNGANPGELRAQLLRHAVPEIADFLTRYRAGQGTPVTRFAQGPGSYYSTPTLREWLDARHVWQHPPHP